MVTRQNVDQLDEFKRIADGHGATLRLTRLRPSGRGADVWDELHPLPEQQRTTYDWPMAHGGNVLTGDSFPGLRLERSIRARKAVPNGPTVLHTRSPHPKSSSDWPRSSPIRS